MARLFALADLHLSLNGEKPMDVFGEQWRDHAQRMAANWDSTVSATDTVLLPGDLSWARSLEEAAPDLLCIAERPVHKILLKGNHDSWWSSRAKLSSALSADCDILQHDSVRISDTVIIGARGWTSPGDPHAVPADEPLFRRELERLKLSIAHADRLHGLALPRVAMLHYPPWIKGQPPTEVVTLLKDAGASVCVYGHLHGEDHRLAVTGHQEGIDYHLVASDAVAFSPVTIGVI
jgi:predicted phosphohydrolase